MKFFKNVKKEFDKIHWATRKEMFSDFWYILGFSLFLVVFFGVLDLIINSII